MSHTVEKPEERKPEELAEAPTPTPAEAPKPPAPPGPQVYVIDGDIFTIYYDVKVIGVGPGTKIEAQMDSVLLGGAVGYVSEATMATYFYTLCKRYSLEEAVSRIERVRTSRCVFVPVDEEISTRAAKLLCKHGDKLALDEAFLIATAQAKNATVLTTSESVRDVAQAEGLPVVYVKAHP